MKNAKEIHELCWTIIESADAIWIRASFEDCIDNEIEQLKKIARNIIQKYATNNNNNIDNCLSSGNLHTVENTKTQPQR